MRRRAKYILFFAYATGVGILSLWPGASLPKAPGFLAFAHADKLIHGVMYAIMVVLGAYTALPPRQSRLPLAAILFASAYGAILEILQTSITPVARTASAADIAANLAGTLSGSLIFLAVQRMPLFPNNHPQQEW